MAESEPALPAPKPSRRSRRKVKGRAGRKHARNRERYARRFAQSVGIQNWPLNAIPGHLQAKSEPVRTETPRGPETPQNASQAITEPKPAEQPASQPAAGGGNLQAIADGIFDQPDDIRLLRKLMIERSWQIPAIAFEKIPQDLVFIFFGKLRKGNELKDADVPVEIRLMAARLLQMMQNSNQAAIAQALPSRGQIKVKATSRIEQPGGTSLSTEVGVCIYLPDNERDVIDSTAEEPE